MNTKTTISISEARAKIFDIADNVQKASNYYTLTERGKPKAVIVSAKEFESYLETLEAIKDFPCLEKDIKEAERDLKEGKVFTLEEVLAENGFVVSDKNVSNNLRKACKKRPK